MNPRTRMRYAGPFVPAVTLLMLGASGPAATPPIPPPSGPIRPVGRTQDEALALPRALPDSDKGARGPAVTPPPPSPSPSTLGMPLIPGQMIQPIDLPGALRL